MSWFSSNYEPTAEVAAAECDQARCDGELHYADRRDPITNEDIEVGPCPQWRAAA